MRSWRCFGAAPRILWFKIINSLKNEIKEKKDELKLLILKEEYEKAADFHDKIKDIELKIQELKGE